MNNLTDSQSWQALRSHYCEMEAVRMRDLFEQDEARYQKFSLQVGDLLLDYSKNRIVDKTLKLLCQLAEGQGLSDQIDQLFNGQLINQSERRAALHTALRDRGSEPIWVQGRDIRVDVLSNFARMQTFVNDVREARYCGFSGESITDVVNLGIGGSDLGPGMAYMALQSYADNIKCHYYSFCDEHYIKERLAELDPRRTIVIVVSKSFTTQETLTMARYAKHWLMEAGSDLALNKQFIAVTANIERALAFGVAKANVFPLWDWVGGRFSLWSSVGLSLALAIGMEHFSELLAGAEAMDVHFRQSDFNRNMPVILALLNIWYNNFFEATTKAIIPYSRQLQFFPAYLQQLHMESQGKNVAQNGMKLTYTTGPILWGGTGSNSQHSFHQLLMQGSHLVPVDFILPLKVYPNSDFINSQLIANCFAQSRTLMNGHLLKEAIADLKSQGLDDEQAKHIAPHKVIPGNCPSNVLLLSRLNPYNLGLLLALYEHKVFVQSVIWNINAFDQWGVEQGKRLASQLVADLQNCKLSQNYDHSTSQLMQHVLGSVENEESRVDE